MYVNIMNFNTNIINCINNYIYHTVSFTFLMPRGQESVCNITLICHDRGCDIIYNGMTRLLPIFNIGHNRE